MPDFRKMTVQRLRDLARKVLGPGYSRLKTKEDLVAALERAEKKPPQAATPSRATPRATVADRAARAVQKAGKAAGETVRAAGDTVRAAARVGKAATQAGRAAAEAAAAGVREAARSRREGKASKAEKAAAAPARARRGAGAEDERERGREGGPNPDGFFVARVRGEEAVREAPYPLGEAAGEDRDYRAPDEAAGADLYEEGLGELPWGYGDDAFVALPRDPRTMFLYWDLARGTVDAGFSGLDHPRAQLWIFARAGEGWDRVRAIEFALESRGWYLHDLEPGRTYRAEIHAVDRAGRDRLVGRASNEVRLPPVGPSPIVDDRFLRLPWDLPFGQLLGPGHAGAPFPDEARGVLARLSDWSRFPVRTSSQGAGGMGGRPSSPSSPSSPFGGERGK